MWLIDYNDYRYYWLLKNTSNIVYKVEMLIQISLVSEKMGLIKVSFAAVLLCFLAVGSAEVSEYEKWPIRMTYK